MNKLHVALLFGGKSAEHEVSLNSAKNVFDALDKSKYEVTLIKINKAGEWLLCPDNFFSTDFSQDGKLLIPIVVIPECSGIIRSFDGQSLAKIDVVFPILHGPFGEDGTVQGLLKLANVPFVGAGVLGSAVGMDKDVMKRLLREANIPIGKFVTIKSIKTIPDFDLLVKDLGLPFFVKPANMGSSVGISKVKKESDYLCAVNLAFEYDNKIVIEEYITGREIECSVLGAEVPRASVPGEIKPTHEFYSYEAKYLDEKGAVLVIPANLSLEQIMQIKKIAIQTFVALDCFGFGRVDFFLKETGEIVVNEINTIPGFTKISMYPKLWEASGLNYPQLIDELIHIAIERFKSEQKLKTTF